MARHAWHFGCALALAGCPRDLPAPSAFADSGITPAQVADAGSLADGDAASDVGAVVDAASALDAVADVTDGWVVDAKDVQNLADTTDAIAAPDAADTGSLDATGKPCTSADDCGPAPAACAPWQCVGLCYPNLLNGGACEDGDPCTTGDVCFIGTCQKGQPKACDDQNPCTTDSCGQGGACQHPSVADGADCGGGKACAAGACVGGIGTGVAAVIARGAQTCALVGAKGQQALCWGDDDSLQTGTGKTSGKWLLQPEPVKGLPPTSQLACGGRHCCAVTSLGLHCWGDDRFGQASGKGGGQVEGKLVKAPTLVDVPAAKVAVGEFHTCALDAGGTVRCWGLGSSGQLGDGTDDKVGVAPVVAAITGADDLACGRWHCCARVVGGMQCWGMNQSGQVGIGTSAAADAPIATKGVTAVAQLALGEEHSCARLSGGAVWCWGANSAGQAGGPGSMKLTPAPVGAGTYAAVAAGGEHTCALTTAGALVCWGANGKRQAAPESSAFLITEPTAVASGLFGGAALLGVAAGADHTCVRAQSASGGALWCWGGNNLGQLGIGGTKDTPTPTVVQ